MATMHTTVQHGKVFAFVAAVHEENCWIICVTGIERLQIIFTDVSQQSEY